MIWRTKLEQVNKDSVVRKFRTTADDGKTYDAPNAAEELKQPRKHPTAEKVEAIKDALKHFEVI